MEGNINLYTFIIVKPLSENKQYKHILTIHLYIICKLSCTGNYSSDVRFHPHSCPLVLPKSESCIKSFATGELYTETKISLVIRRIYSYTPCRDTAISPGVGYLFPPPPIAFASMLSYPTEILFMTTTQKFSSINYPKLPLYLE